MRIVLLGFCFCVSSVTAAPNGRYVAYTVRSIILDMDDDYHYQSEI